MSSFANKARLACMRVRDVISNAVKRVKEIGSGIAKSIREWTKKHPLEITTILVLLIVMATTPTILAAMGFTTAGIAAGMVSVVDKRQYV
jgi:hypothetical protein